MSAILKLYSDEACTKELYLDRFDELDERLPCYSAAIGPKNGIDGDAGEVYNNIIYIKNVGDTPAIGVKILESGDHDRFCDLTLDFKVYEETNLYVGDIYPNTSKMVSISIIVPSGAPSSEQSNSYVIEYVSSPGSVELQSAQLYTKDNYNGVEACTHIEEFNLVGGAPYNRTGPYGVPLYGQEGLVHIKKEIVAFIPIAGRLYTKFSTSYKINSRYDETYTTIENVQSFDTISYMDYEAFYGPILPLWLDDGNT